MCVNKKRMRGTFDTFIKFSWKLYESWVLSEPINNIGTSWKGLTNFHVLLLSLKPHSVDTISKKCAIEFWVAIHVYSSIVKNENVDSLREKLPAHLGRWWFMCSCYYLIDIWRAPVSCTDDL